MPGAHKLNCVFGHAGPVFICLNPRPSLNRDERSRHTLGVIDIRDTTAVRALNHEFLEACGLCFGRHFSRHKFNQLFRSRATAGITCRAGNVWANGKRPRYGKPVIPRLKAPERDELLPKLTSNEHRVDWRDLNRAKEMTAALNCYLVTHPNAICERNNRAYIVDYINRYFAKFDEMIEYRQAIWRIRDVHGQESLGQPSQPGDQRGLDAGHQQWPPDQGGFRLVGACGHEADARSLQGRDRQLPQGLAVEWDL